MAAPDLAFLLDHPSLAFVQTDVSGTLIYVSSAWAGMIGSSSESSLGRWLGDCFLDSEHRTLSQALETLATGAIGHSVVTARLAHSPRYVELTLRAQRAANGVITGFGGSCRDVTRRERRIAQAYRYRLVVDHASDIILFITDTGRILDANPAATEAYGYPYEELVTKSVLELRASDAVPTYGHDFAAALAGPQRFETVHRRRDGRPFPVEVSSQPVMFGGERLLISIIRDISERERLEAERERERRTHAALLQAQSDLGVGYVMIDQERIVYTNEAFCRMSGYDQAELLEVPSFFALLAPEHVPELRDRYERRSMQTSKLNHYVTRMIRKDARPVDVEASVASLETGGETAKRIVMIRDISERTEVDRLKSDFLNAVTHELRTPLTSIRGFAEFLEDGVGGTLSEAQHTFLKHIQQGTAQLELLVDDLLDFARIEAGKFNLRLQTFDGVALVAHVVASFQLQAHDQGVLLQASGPDAPLEIEADPNRLTQILNNLLSNALKFTPCGGRVQVEVAATDQHWHLRVRDTGIGIPSEQLSHLFTKFYQGESSLNRTFKGTGLGLAITRGLIEAHHGTISVESEVGQGTAFRIELPRVQPPVSARAMVRPD